MIPERRSSAPRAMSHRRRRFPHEPADRRWYGVRAGFQTGPIQGWQNCLRSVRGYEQAEYQRCLNRQDAQDWCDSNPQPCPTTPLSQTSRFSSPTGFFSNEANSFSISSGSSSGSVGSIPTPTGSVSGSGELFSNEANSFSPSAGSSSGWGGSLSIRTTSPDRRILDDRLRTERNINALQELLRNLNVGETVSITRGEDDFDFMYTIGSNPRSLD